MYCKARDPRMRFVVIFIVMSFCSSYALTQELEPHRENIPDAPSVHKEKKAPPFLARTFRVSRYALGVTGAFDEISTVTALKLHPEAQEVGWASFLGKRNVAGVVLANGALNYGVHRFSDYLATKGRAGLIVATGLNFWKSGVNFQCGMGNVMYRSHK